MALKAVQSLKEDRQRRAEAERVSRKLLNDSNNPSPADAHTPTRIDISQDMIVINIWQGLPGQTPSRVAYPKKISRGEISDLSLTERKSLVTQFVTSELYDVQLRNGYFKKGKKKGYMGAVAGSANSVRYGYS